MQNSDTTATVMLTILVMSLCTLYTKTYSLAEVCSLLSALLVQFLYLFSFSLLHNFVLKRVQSMVRCVYYSKDICNIAVLSNLHFTVAHFRY